MSIACYSHHVYGHVHIVVVIVCDFSGKFTSDYLCYCALSVSLICTPFLTLHRPPLKIQGPSLAVQFNYISCPDAPDSVVARLTLRTLCLASAW